MHGRARGRTPSEDLQRHPGVRGFGISRLARGGPPPRTGARRHPVREVPDHVGLADLLKRGELAHAVPRELRLRQVVPPRKVECLARPGERGTELALGIQEEPERVTLRIGQANGPHARTPWEEKILPVEINPPPGRIEGFAGGAEWPQPVSVRDGSDAPGPGSRPAGRARRIRTASIRFSRTDSTRTV